MHTSQQRAAIWHRVFGLGMWIKAIDGALEIAGGILLLLVSSAALNRFVVALTQHELVEDPHDLIATALRHSAAQLSANSQLLASMYLVAHGLIKIGLVAGLLRGKRWAYPAAIGVLGLFIAYQCYRLSYHYSPGLLLLTLFDCAIVGLTWREYRAPHAGR